VETNVGIEEMKMKKPSLFGMITSPAVQFERMRGKTPIAMPLIILLLITAISGALASYISLNNPEISEALAEAEFKVPIAVTLGMGAVGALFGGAVVYFLSAAFYKVCMVLLGNDTTYRQLLGIVIYSSIISALGVLINIGIALAIGGYEPTYTSLAPLFSDRTLHAIAANFDIFNIWSYFVIGLGLNKVAGLSKTKATILVAVIFLIGVGLSSLTGLLPQA
jgi:hypothetical protein